MITVSALGKIHLIGEHAVVYGEPAIIAAIGERCHVSIEKIKIFDRQAHSDLKFSAEDVISFASEMRKLWNEGFEKRDFSNLLTAMRSPSEFKKAAAGQILSSLGIESGFTMDIKSDIPIGAGLGSSASLAVAMTKATAELNGIGISNEKTNEIAYQIEKFTHVLPISRIYYKT